METTLPEGMRRALRELREAGEPLAVEALAQRLLALRGPPRLGLAQRLVGGILGSAPGALPGELAPRELRAAEESAAAALPLGGASFAVVDVETTGLDAARDALIEIGAVRVTAGRVRARFETLVRPPGPGPLSARIAALTGIDADMLGEAPPARTALAGFRRWLGSAPGAPWVAHNARFDHAFLVRAFRAQLGEVPRVAVLCTQKLARRLLPQLGRYDLDHVCAHFGIRNRARHRALGDAEATARAWIELLELARSHGCAHVGDLLDLQERPTRRRRSRRRAAPGVRSRR